MSFGRSYWVLGILAPALFACSGDPGSEGGEGSDSSTGASTCTSEQLGEQPLRRLSSEEYELTLLDLLGPELGAALAPGSIFPQTEITSGFHSDAEANTVNSAESHAIEDNAERIGTYLLEHPEQMLSQLLPCAEGADLSDEAITACMPDFIESFGHRAYRRPLTFAELSVVQGLFDELSAEEGARLGLAATVQFFVESPALLYRVERGETEVSPGVFRLSSPEIATRLAYFLTGGPPDEELRRAALAGELSEAAQVESQAMRLLGTDAFRQTVKRFFRDYLKLYELEHLAKDPELFPAFDETMRSALSAESGALIDAVYAGSEPTLGRLFSTDELPVQSATASLYSVASESSEFEFLRLPERRGILSQAGLMAVLSHQNRTNPIHRGVVLMRDLLCRELPAFPGNVDTETVLRDSSTLPTARERLAPLLETGQCAGCHRLFNPVGLAFENYDAVGAYRETENGATIDASGSFDLDGEEVAFGGPLDMISTLATSRELSACYSRQWLRYMLGRYEQEADACLLEGVDEAVHQAGGNLESAVRFLVSSEAFVLRRNQP